MAISLRQHELQTSTTGQSSRLPLYFSHWSLLVMVANTGIDVVTINNYMCRPHVGIIVYVGIIVQGRKWHNHYAYQVFLSYIGKIC